MCSMSVFTEIKMCKIFLIWFSAVFLFLAISWINRKTSPIKFARETFNKLSDYIFRFFEVHSGLNLWIMLICLPHLSFIRMYIMLNRGHTLIRHILLLHCWKVLQFTVQPIIQYLTVTSTYFFSYFGTCFWVRD